MGAGFHPEFTGRENLYFGGALIGIDEATMRGLEAGIIEFAELADAMDRPVKSYSSGMVVRLAFALVTALEPDVLIIDEALAVGDQHFQKKCVERIEAFRRSGCTILFCSHSLYHIRQLCDVAMWLDGGRVRAQGDTEHVLAAYEAHVRSLDDRGRGAAVQRSAADPAAESVAPRSAGIDAVVVHGLGEGAPPRLAGPDLVVEVTAHAPVGERPNVGVMLEQANGVGITSVGSHVDEVPMRALANGCWQLAVRFPDLPLHSGEYVVSVYLFDSAGIVVYDEWLHCQHFLWIDPASTPGLLRLPHQWS